MYKLVTIIAVVVLFSCNSSKQSIGSNQLSSEEKSVGWKLLFNGSNTKGWHKYGGKPVGAAWKVKDDYLYLDTSSKDGGDIVTDEEYDNFDFQVEWRISKNGNSGIIFYIHEDKATYNWPWETGPEMQVLDNIGAEDNKKGNHVAGTLYDLAGSYEVSRPKPVGDWNLTEIKCINGKLDLYLNGVNTVSTTLWDDNWRKMVAGSKFRNMHDFGTYKKGRIGLQDHGNEVSFRNIKIRKL